MKKLLTVTVAALLAVSVCAFTACTDKNTKESVGVIKGNYKEVEAAQLQTVLETVENNTESNLSGLEFTADLSLSYGVANVMSVSADASLAYKLAMTVSEEEIDVAGSGEGKLNYKSETAIADGSKTTVETPYDFKIYNDCDYMYLDVSKGTDQKLKIGLDEIFDRVIDYIPGDDEGEETSVAEMLGTLSEAGVKTYLDNTDGIKIKLSITKDCFDKVLENVIDSTDGVIPDEIAGMITAFTSSLEFTALKFDMYFAFDNAGTFLQFATDIDIALTVDASAMGMGEISLSVKGGFSVKAYSGTVTLPEGIAEDDKYQLQTI